MATSSFTWRGPKTFKSSLLFASLPTCKQICQFLLKVYLKTNRFSPFPQPPALFKPSSSLSWLSQLLPAFLAFIFAPLQLVLKTGDNVILSKLVFVTPQNLPVVSHLTRGRSKSPSKALRGLVLPLTSWFPLLFLSLSLTPFSATTGASFLLKHIPTWRSLCSVLPLPSVLFP